MNIMKLFSLRCLQCRENKISTWIKLAATRAANSEATVSQLKAVLAE
ncbi:hypothetical protein [Bartonella sp. CB169]